VFTAAAGILPAVEPGILPGEHGVWSGKALAIWDLQSGGKMPPSTAAKMAAATDLLRTVNHTLPWGAGESFAARVAYYWSDGDARSAGKAKGASGRNRAWAVRFPLPAGEGQPAGTLRFALRFATLRYLS